jgi:hypothetical protein
MDKTTDAGAATAMETGEMTVERRTEQGPDNERRRGGPATPGAWGERRAGRGFVSL